MREFRLIPITELRPDPDQPRKEFDDNELLSLAESIKAIGVQVPLIVVEMDGEPRKER